MDIKEKTRTKNYILLELGFANRC